MRLRHSLTDSVPESRHDEHGQAQVHLSLGDDVPALRYGWTATMMAPPAIAMRTIQASQIRPYRQPSEARPGYFTTGYWLLNQPSKPSSSTTWFL